MLCFLIEFCSGYLFLLTQRAGPRAGRCGSSSVPSLLREAVFPTGAGPAAAPQRHPVAAGSLPGACAALPWTFRLTDKSPELSWDNQAAAAGSRAAWAFWGTSEGSLGANSLCAYGTVSYTYGS